MVKPTSINCAILTVIAVTLPRSAVYAQSECRDRSERIKALMIERGDGLAERVGAREAV